MAKRDKLYTVNRWNKPLFEEERRRKLYLGGGDKNTPYGFNPYLHTGLDQALLTAGLYHGWGNDYQTSVEKNAASNQLITNSDYRGNYNPVMNQAGTYAALPDTDLTPSGEKKKSPTSSSLSDIIDITKTAADAFRTSNYTKNLHTLAKAGAQAGSITSAVTPTFTIKPQVATNIAKPTADTVMSNISKLASTPTASLYLGATVTPGTKAAVVDSAKRLANGLKGSARNGNISNLTKAGVNLGASVLGEVGKNIISNGFNTVPGLIIDTVGNVAGSILPFIPGVGWAAAPIVIGASKLLAGATNAAFGTKTFDNGATAYTNRLNSLNPNGSNEYLVNLMSSIGTGPQATYKDGWLRDKGKNEAATINAASDVAFLRFQRGVRDAINNNNIMQLWHALNDSAITAMGGKLNRKKCNCKAEGGILNTSINPVSAAGYDILSTYLTTQAMKNLASQDTGSSIGNSFMGTDTGTLFADGGIMIKPENKGKLTRLKKRTGKTEAELYNDGNPAHRKMVTFARNARKWKKAYGGFLDAANNLSEIEKTLYGSGGTLENKNQDNWNNILLGGASRYDLGGVLQAGGSNWGNVTEIGAGGQHETNPYQGVQVGVDPEGTPNLVEEGEVIWNDYVFSDRIECPKEICKSLRVGVKKNGFTFAEVAKKLLAESKERPNDPISKRGLAANMQKLEGYQEEVKQKMEAEKAVDQFNSLPPEQQVAIMNQEGQKAQDAVAQQQMAQELQNMPPEQQQAIAQQMMAEQAAAQGMPQGGSPEEQAMMQQQYAAQQDAAMQQAAAEQQYQQQRAAQHQQALALAAAMQQQALNGAAYGGRLFAEGGMIPQEQPTEQTTEQVDSEMAKYSDEELQEIINEYEEAANGEKKVTKGKLARLRKKAERAERELERRNSEGESAEQEQSGSAEGQPQEPTQEQVLAAAQAQAQQQMMEGQPLEGMPLEGMSPELAMMMQQLMGQQMSPEEMAMMQQQGNSQYGCGGKLYLTGGELAKMLGFENTADAPFTKEDLGIKNWYDEIPEDFDFDPIYKKLNNPVINLLKSLGWTPFSKREDIGDWYEPTGGSDINWTEAGERFKKKGYTYDDLLKMTLYYPYMNWVLNTGLSNWDWESKPYVDKDTLMRYIKQTADWNRTDRWLRDPNEGLKRRTDYIARRYGLDPSLNDKKFYDTWSLFGDFTQETDEKTGKTYWTYNLKKDKQADFDKEFWRSRGDGVLGTMYDVLVSPKSREVMYILDENGNPTGDILTGSTDGYEQVGPAHEFATKGDGKFDPKYNNNVSFWKKSDKSSSSASENTDESKLLTTGWKPKTNWTDYLFGALPGIAGLSMMLGQGKPDTSGIEAAADYYANSGAGTTVGPHLTHGLIKPAIIDPRITHNTLNTSRLGTNRLLRNTGSAPSQAASILANDINYQNQMGQNDLRDWLANRLQEQTAAQFNRETATTNANILNNTDQFNAQMLANRAEKSAQLRYNAAKEKLDQENAYRAGLLGNIGSIFTGINEARKQQNVNNQRDLLLASGVFGNTNPFLENYYGISKVDPETGQVKRGYRTGDYWRINPVTGEEEYSKTPFLATPTLTANGGKLKKKTKKRKGYTF